MPNCRRCGRTNKTPGYCESCQRLILDETRELKNSEIEQYAEQSRIPQKLSFGVIASLWPVFAIVMGIGMSEPGVSLSRVMMKAAFFSSMAVWAMSGFVLLIEKIAHGQYYSGLMALRLPYFLYTDTDLFSRRAPKVYVLHFTAIVVIAVSGLFYLTSTFAESTSGRDWFRKLGGTYTYCKGDTCYNN